MVNDAYQELSIKNNTRRQRGDDHIKTVTEGFEQHMAAGMKWNEFSRNAKNILIHITHIIVKFIESSKGRQLINSPFIVTVRDKIYGFQDGQYKVNGCNHEEADTRIILLAYQEVNDVVVVAKDTNVLVWF